MPFQVLEMVMVQLTVILVISGYMMVLIGLMLVVLEDLKVYKDYRV